MSIRRGATLLSAALLTLCSGLAEANQGHVTVKKQLVEIVNARLAAIPPDAVAKPGANATTGKTHATGNTAVHGSAGAPLPPHSDAVSSEAIWEGLLSGNGRFISGRTQLRPVVAQRAELVSGQHPNAIVLACADSRVAPELLFDQSLGDIFVVRTAGNVADPVAIGSLEYAVEHLGAHVLIVLGHETCGAVKAALSGDRMPSANLQAIVDHITPALEKPRICFEGEELLSRSVASNVHQSAREVLANSAILREHIEARKLSVFKAVYDLKTGQVRPLE